MSAAAAPGTGRGALPVLPGSIATWLAPLSALVVAALVHFPALRTFFASDDIVFLARARGLEPAPLSFGRILSGAARWRLFAGAFGLDPLPWHIVNLLFHLVNVGLVYAVARRMPGGGAQAEDRGAGGGRAPAWAAAVLFGVSSIAFTPLHWAAGFGEILATTLALSALLLFLVARQGRASRGPAGDAAAPARPPAGPAPAALAASSAPAWLWLSALAALVAGLSKESVLLLPLVLLIADRRLGTFRPRLRTLIPAAVAGLVLAAGFAATLRSTDYLGGEAYALDLSPLFLLQNLATFLRWSVAFWMPLRDVVATMQPGAMPVGLLVLVLVSLLLRSQRNAVRHPEEVGAAWFLLLLAPVLPLKHHTYLYYLYIPWAGACWLAAGAGARLARRVPALAPLLLLLPLALAGVEAWSVRVRERAMTGTILADRTIRESTLLRNVVASLDSARLAPGARVAFVNPAPRKHSSLAGGQQGEKVSYLPLERAMHGGRALQLFFPGVRYLGFADTLPRDWEDAEVFLWQDEGTARHLGRGGRALAELGYFTLRTRQWERADAMFRRSLALGDTLPDAVFGLGVSSSFLGREAQARAWAAEFVRRWPGDERAPVVRRGLEGRGAAPAPAR